MQLCKKERYLDLHRVSIIILLSLFCILFSIKSAHGIQDKLDMLFEKLVTSDTATSTRTTAIIPFSVSLEEAYPDIGRMVAEYAVVFFSVRDKYRVVERMEFVKVMEEQKLSQSDMVDEEQALQIGKLLAADVIITGAITNALGKRMISARMIQTETGQVMATSSVTVGSDHLEEFYKDALGERASASSSIFRSLLAPGWGQFYNERKARGFCYSILSACGVGTTIFTYVKWKMKNNDVKNSHKYIIENKLSLEEAEEYEQMVIDKRDRAERILYTSFGITAGIWIINVIDAAIVGKREAGRIKEFYFSVYPYEKSGCYTMRCGVLVEF